MSQNNKYITKIYTFTGKQIGTIHSAYSEQYTLTGKKISNMHIINKPVEKMNDNTNITYYTLTGKKISGTIKSKL
jgi:hypothetical protein